MIMVTLATYAALRGRSVPQPSSSCGNAADGRGAATRKPGLRRDRV